MYGKKWRMGVMRDIIIKPENKKIPWLIPKEITVATKVTCGCEEMQDKTIHSNKTGRMLAIPGRYDLKNKVSSDKHVGAMMNMHFCNEVVILMLSRW